MIHIFFVPGMFGSTIEHVLRNYTNEMEPTNAVIAKDGSMHTYKKMNHLVSGNALEVCDFQEINTPIYPFANKHFSEILESYHRNDSNDKYVLVYAKTFNDAELNILFQYYKISLLPSMGMHIFYGSPENAYNNVSRWNLNYKEYSDLKRWEFREWFSIFYPTWVNEWQNSVSQVSNDWLKISSGEILFNTASSFEKIIDFCGLTKSQNVNEFATNWRSAQQYILDEYNLIHKIVELTTAQKKFSWNSLNVISESIVQQKLRTAGYEIRCDGLDVFPTNSLDLYNLLYPL